MNGPRTALVAVVLLALLGSPSAAAATAGTAPAAGGAMAPAGEDPPASLTGTSVGASGGSEAAGAPVEIRPSGPSGGSAGPAEAVYPALRSLSVPSHALAGAPPRVTLQVTERGAATLYVTLALLDSSRRPVMRLSMGWVRTGRNVAVRWPASARLAAGTYTLQVGVRDHRGNRLPRTARSAATASLRVTAAPAPAPAPSSGSPAPTAPASQGAPTVAQTLAAGAVFPVGGAHSFGGPEDRYGAPRGSHIHEGQDVLTEEGTPVLAPLAGTISWTSYQASGAGYYAVEHTALGLDLMFAHCKAGSLAVSAGSAVAPGTRLCLAGQTGDASAPHLHFEIWVGGWWAPGGHTIDPLPYLQAWERA